MSDSNSSAAGGGIGCLTVVGIVFVVLKLVGTIDWSWWYVLMPFTIQFGIILICILIIIIAFLINSKRERK